MATTATTRDKKKETLDEDTKIDEGVSKYENSEFESYLENLLPEASPQQKEKAESVPELVGRNTVRSMVNVGTTLAGLPGDLAQFFGDYVWGPTISYITGKKQPTKEETAKWRGYSVLPTTEHVEKKAKEILPKWATTPQDVFESAFDDVIKDTTSLLAPLPGASKLEKAMKWTTKARNAFLTALGANAAYQGTLGLTSNENTASYAKLGSMFLLSYFGRPKAAEYVSELYKDAKSNLPEGATTSAKILTDELGDLKSTMLKGTLAPSEKFIVDEIDAIIPKIKNGSISVEEAWSSKRSLNEKLQKIIYESPDKASKQRARRLSSKIQSAFKDTIEEYGKTNPNFYKPFKDAETAFGAIAQSEFVTNFMKENLNYDPKTSYLKSILTGVLGVGAKGLGAGIGTAAAGAGGFATYQSAKAIYQIANSPALRKHYFDVVRAASQQNIQAFNREVKKLDEALQEKEVDEVYEMLPDYL